MQTLIFLCSSAPTMVSDRVAADVVKALIDVVDGSADCSSWLCTGGLVRLESQEQLSSRGPAVGHAAPYHAWGRASPVAVSALGGRVSTSSFAARMAKRADLTLFPFDAQKLDISDDFLEVMEVLRDCEERDRGVLNRADEIDAANFVQVLERCSGMWARYCGRQRWLVCTPGPCGMKVTQDQRFVRWKHGSRAEGSGRAVEDRSAAPNLCLRHARAPHQVAPLHRHAHPPDLGVLLRRFRRDRTLGAMS